MNIGKFVSLYALKIKHSLALFDDYYDVDILMNQIYLLVLFIVNWLICIFIFYCGQLCSNLLPYFLQP